MQTEDNTAATADDYGWGEALAALAAAAPRVSLHPDHVAVDLITPIMVAGEEATALRFTEPDTKQLAQLDRVKGEMAGAIKLVEISGGLSAIDVGRLKARDFALISRVLACFLGESPETGAT